MHTIAWSSAIGVLVCGLVAGTIFFFWIRRRTGAALGAAAALGRVGESTESSEHRQRISDLEQEKAQLFEQLRELRDDTSTTSTSGSNAEQASLERRAAEIIRELDTLQTSAAFATTPPPTGAKRLSPEMRGGLIGAGVVAFAAIIAFTVVKTSRPRSEGMGPTGNDPMSMAPRGGSATSNEAAQRAAHGEEETTPRLEQARAAAQAHPESIAALSELGYAALEANGWMEAFKAGQQVLAKQPDDADGAVLVAAVRMAMGQTEVAGALLDRALAAHPKHVQALVSRARVSFLTGKREEAIASLEKAKTQGGSTPAIDALIAEVKQGKPERGMMAPAGHPPMGAPHPAMGSSAAATTASSQTISGVVRLAKDATTYPKNGFLFVIARPAGVTTGPPVAVKRLSISTLPVTFTLGQQDSMMGGTLPASLQLSAHVDSDGSATTHQPGDLIGALDAPVKLGSSGVELLMHPVK